MPIFETFHERQAKLRASTEDVYIYERVSRPLKVQIVQLMEDMLGDEEEYSHYAQYGQNVRRTYGAIVDILRRAIGEFLLPPRKEYHNENFLIELKEYMLGEDNAERFMSAVELVCRLGENRASNDGYSGKSKAKERVTQLIADVNTRIKQHGVGYEYDGEMIRIDSEFVHAEAVKPALALFRGDTSYRTAEDEFLKAHEHFRSGDTKDALTNALKAFESTMKIVATKRGWTFDSKDTASKLIDLCYSKGLIPDYWQSHFSGLRSVLESGIPTARNRAGGHGAGPSPQSVPEHLAAYVLHMTASTIVFLVQAEKALP